MDHIIWSALDDWTTSVLMTYVGAAKIVTVPRKILTLSMKLTILHIADYYNMLCHTNK